MESWFCTEVAKIRLIKLIKPFFTCFPPRGVTVLAFKFQYPTKKNVISRDFHIFHNFSRDL